MHDRFAPRLRRYSAAIAEAITQARRSRFYVSGDLELSAEPDWVVVSGTIQCLGGIRVEIFEQSRILHARSWFHKANPLLELLAYRNNAVLSGRGNIFRYNSPHSDHRRYHHVHRYDVFGDGAQIMPPKQLHEREVPTIREVMKEAEHWYHANLGKLPNA